MLAYWLLVCRRAAAETGRSLSLTWGTFYRTVLVSAVGVVIAWRGISRESAVTTAVAMFSSVILANIVVFFVLFLIYVFRAPALIHREQQTARDERDEAIAS